MTLWMIRCFRSAALISSCIVAQRLRSTAFWKLLNCAALVGAEIARLESRELDAERLYEQAIRSARANGFIHNEALRLRSGLALLCSAWLRRVCASVSAEGALRLSALGSRRQSAAARGDASAS